MLVLFQTALPIISVVTVLFQLIARLVPRPPPEAPTNASIIAKFGLEVVSPVQFMIGVERYVTCMTDVSK